MAQLTDRVLQYLDKNDGVDTLKLAEKFEEDHQKVIGAVKSLQSLGDIIEAEQLSRMRTDLTAEGKSFVEKGSHEAIVYAAVPPGDAGIPQPELMKATGAAGKIGMSKAIQNGWIKLSKEGGVNKVIRQVDSIEDIVTNKLKSILAGSEVDTASLADLKKRKLLIQTPVNYYNLKRGKGFTLQLVKLETELTPEMLASGEWRQKKFKPYNFQALGASLTPGHLHPLMKVRSEFRSILLEMGFSEMPTNRFIESSFWNFDALFVPQKHPARDAQDTFFMSQPEKCTSIPVEFMKRVRAAHTGTDYDTLGYGPTWKEEEAYKNVLRTHTTAISARMLYEIGSKPEFKPSKLFSIDRVYRNETLDATHLAEFHQVEGVVADYNLNLGNLIAIMKEFFSRLGITKLRFKPAYNPYTEPSMEVFSYHEGLKKWVEIGNSGMFRPEMLLPMGLPKDVRVIAWGLSLERPTMIRYGINNIRDLVGHKIDLQMVYNNPICRLDKNFEIGSDGKYLDNPLLKSPKRQQGAVAAALSTTSQQPNQDEAQESAKKAKKKRKRNKKKETSEVSTNTELLPSGSGADNNQQEGEASQEENVVPSTSKQAVAAAAAANKTATASTSKSNSKTKISSTATTAGDGSNVKASGDDKAAAGAKVKKGISKKPKEVVTTVTAEGSTQFPDVEAEAAVVPQAKGSKKKKKATKVKSTEPA